MKVRYEEGPEESHVEPKDGSPFFTARRGEWVEVDLSAAAAKSLEAQGWETESKGARAKTEKEK